MGIYIYILFTMIPSCIYGTIILFSASSKNTMKLGTLTRSQTTLFHFLRVRVQDMRTPWHSLFGASRCDSDHQLGHLRHNKEILIAKRHRYPGTFIHVSNMRLTLHKGNIIEMTPDPQVYSAFISRIKAPYILPSSLLFSHPFSISIQTRR